MRRGHTLLELLVAIAVLMILSSMVLIRFIGPQATTRDKVRESDLQQYKTAIELYANGHAGLYPSWTTETRASIGTGLCGNLGLCVGSCSCSEDPKYSTDPVNHVYMYLSDGTGGGTNTALNFVLWTKLEKVDEFLVVCSSNKAGRVSLKPSSSSCPL